MNEEDYMRAALEQARQAGACDEVPVGAVVVCDGFVIQEQHLPLAVRLPVAPALPQRSTLKEAVAALESRMLTDALGRARGNCARAARELGVSERVVRYKASIYGIDVQGLRE